uniref:Cyclodipeptide synthase n=1 Tax=Nocardiopsis sp. CMB-M0232 TaxID=1231934 RepID=A0A0R7QWN6_9ACTN|nr:cyclodipeptide synthase [Nocardiopsis sp. CMB-M0232]
MHTVSVERDGDFHVTPLTDNCRDLMKAGGHALLGVSHGNSYFSRGRLSNLFAWALRRFDAVDVVAADSHVVEIFRAIGYDDEHARKRTHKETSVLRNRIRDAAAQCGADRTRITLRGLSDFMDDPAYRSVLSETQKALDDQPEFRNAARAMTRAVLESRLGPGNAREDQIDIAFSYLQAELPFFHDAPRILRVESTVSCYHMRLPLLDFICGPRAVVPVVPTQGFAVVRPADPG